MWHDFNLNIYFLSWLYTSIECSVEIVIISIYHLYNFSMEIICFSAFCKNKLIFSLVYYKNAVSIWILNAFTTMWCFPECVFSNSFGMYNVRIAGVIWIIVQLKTTKKLWRHFCEISPERRGKITWLGKLVTNEILYYLFFKAILFHFLILNTTYFQISTYQNLIISVGLEKKITYGCWV